MHEVAEQLEHIKSPKLIHELDALLGFSKQDAIISPRTYKQGSFILEFNSLRLLNHTLILVCSRLSLYVPIYLFGLVF